MLLAREELRDCREAIYTMKEEVRVLQRKLYRAAKAQKERRFGVLYDKIYRSDILWAAWG